MTVTFFSRIWWSVAFDPEDQSSSGSGYLDMINQGGNITGLATLPQYFFIFQENQYNVYSYQTGSTPLNFIRSIKYGCNYQKTIQEVTKNGQQYLIYLANNGDVRVTNGPTYDESISDNISTIVHGLLNNRSVKDYYSTTPNCVPNAHVDSKNKIYRLFYAGSSSNTNKCLNYHYDKGIWTSGSSEAYNDSYSLIGYKTNLAVMGNSDAGGVTYELTSTMGTSDVGTLDFGWISTDSANKKVKVHNIILWAHAHSACSTTLTITVYNDPSNHTAVKTETRTLAYNSTADNLQKIIFNLGGVLGDYVRLVLTDSGTTSDYSIDKAIINFDAVDSSN
jgi:hypothetical protein